MIIRMDRLGRSLLHLIALGADLRDRGIGLKVLEQSIDTATAEGRAMFGILSVLAEYQRELIVANTRDGLSAARTRGEAAEQWKRGSGPGASAWEWFLMSPNTRLFSEPMPTARWEVPPREASIFSWRVTSSPVIGTESVASRYRCVCPARAAAPKCNAGSGTR